jgi:hypothetical protein
MTRQEEFKQELFALLRKYDVEMSVTEVTYGYNTVAEGINCWSRAKYDRDGNVVATSIDIQFGTSITAP